MTAGRPVLTDVRPGAGNAEEELLALVAAAEADSERPLAAAITDAARERRLTIPAATAFNSVTGKGVAATVDGRKVLVGTARLLEDGGIGTDGLAAAADTVKEDSARAMCELRCCPSTRPTRSGACSAKVTRLISGSLTGVVTAIRLSRATMRNIKQNLFFALVYNAVGVPVAAGAVLLVRGPQRLPAAAPPCCTGAAH